MSVQPTVTDVFQWSQELDSVGRRLGRFFARSEPRRRAVEYVRGLLSNVERKNGRQLAEQASDCIPYGVQQLLGRADWDAEKVRDDLIAYAHGHLADPRGVLVVDEIGFLKKGPKSAGVQRQYSGTAGRQEWAKDAARREEAGIPKDVKFATKPQLAERMLERAWRLWVKAAWVAGNAVYGNDTHFHRFLEANRQPYLLALWSDMSLWDGHARTRIADALPAKAWLNATVGAGSKGPQ